MQRSTPRCLQSSVCGLVLFVVAMFLVGCAPTDDDLLLDEVSVERSALDDEVHDWTHGDWTWRVAYEARYALSKNADGTSDHEDNTNNYIYGDWNYVDGSWGWWIIDANWLRNWSPYDDNYIIGKHFLTDSQLSSYNFYGWNPSLGTDNEE